MNRATHPSLFSRNRRYWKCRFQQRHCSDSLQSHIRSRWPLHWHDIKQDYPVTQRLQQIAGVGPLTALCFVLKIGDPERFSRGRDVGAYLGLCPRRDQSGGTDKQLRISKCGDGLLRRLLVSAAHYVLGPFGPACALREHGQRLTGTGSAREKKRAVVAVARKLSVLLLSLWKYGPDYEPRNTASPALVLIPA